MAEDLGEKTEDATPKRKAEAREEGNVPKSSDVAGALFLLCTTIMLCLGMMPTLAGLKIYVESMLGVQNAEDIITISVVDSLAEYTLGSALKIAMPLLLIAWLIAYLAHFWQVGWLFSLKSIKPSLNKLNPISGFKKIFGINAVVKAGIDGSKILLVFVIVFLTIGSKMEIIIQLPQLEMMEALEKIGWLLFDLSMRILAALLILGFIDFAYQKWKHSRDLRMSKHEIKEEMKQSEGDPQIKKRRMRMQQQISMQRISAAVPNADVIVTNPEHISIAIKYDEQTMHAPLVIAKGADHLAIRIRQIAMKHGIPIVERKPLARALYKSVVAGQEIPPDFFQAVAEILAYVYRLSGKMAS